MTALTKINGFAAEATVQRLAIQSGCKPIKFDTPQLVRIAKATTTGWQRLKLALPHLLSEYGRRTKNGKYTVEWNAVPATVILDYVYGLDAVFLWRGWCIGVDATTNRNAVEEKQFKLQLLKPLWQALHIDSCAVAHVSTNANKNEFVENLRRVIKGETLMQL